MSVSPFSLAVARVAVGFYRFWHGTLGLKGAGRMIGVLAPRVAGLQTYPLEFPNGRIGVVDFRELSAFGCLNTFMGEETQEKGLIEAITSSLTPESIFWDIGANAGLLSAQIAARVPVREHHYFEPNPRIYPWAQVSMAHVPNASGHAVAVSRVSGTATLSLPRNRSAFGSLESRVSGEVDRFEVETIRGDELVYEQGYRPPDVIKIDTEGHEVEVLAGLSRIIREHRPILFFEHIELSDEQVAALVPEGYSLGTVSDETGAILPCFDRSKGHNSALTPKC
jgi:FkbM family methyltransferase